VSRRLIISTLVVAFVVVALLGIPLGVVEVRSIQSRAQTQVRAEATRLLTAVDLRLELGEPVEARSFVWHMDEGRSATIRIPGQPQPIVVGTPVGGGRTLSAELTGARGEVVTVTESREHVDAEIGRALLLILVIALLAIGAAVGMAVLQARRLGAPLVDLARTAERLGSGDPRPRQRRYGVPELDRVAEVLDSSARRIARMLAAERQLAADASHQLRTPLTALSMRLEEIIATDDPATVKEEASLALTQVERLTDVVERLLTDAREPRAAEALPIDVDEVVRQQVDEWRPAYDGAGRRIEVTGYRGLRARATPGALTHVVATLLENSLMHGAGTVQVSQRSSGSSVVVEVTDEGPGVPAELGARVFERSVSGRNSTGLGLAVARDLAEADGGRLELVQRRPPVFAVFLRAYEEPDGPEA
jgi:signal transduction histidine kinase